MIKMIAGRFGLLVDGIVKGMDKNSPPFEATAEQEARLVKMGLAKYVDKPAPVDENSNEGGADGQDNSYKDDEVLEIVDGHFTIESLMKLERKHMEALAADLEIETDAIKKCKNKTELANLIAEVEVGDEDENSNEGGEGAPTFDPSEAVQ